MEERLWAGIRRYFWFTVVIDRHFSGHEFANRKHNIADRRVVRTGKGKNGTKKRNFIFAI